MMMMVMMKMMMMVARVIQSSSKLFMNMSKINKILLKILQHGADCHGELLRVTHFDDDEDDDDLFSLGSKQRNPVPKAQFLKATFFVNEALPARVQAWSEV